jgi:hypothetical protein
MTSCSLYVHFNISIPKTMLIVQSNQSFNGSITQPLQHCSRNGVHVQRASCRLVCLRTRSLPCMGTDVSTLAREEVADAPAPCTVSACMHACMHKPTPGPDCADSTRAVRRAAISLLTAEGSNSPPPALAPLYVQASMQPAHLQVLDAPAPCAVGACVRIQPAPEHLATGIKQLCQWCTVLW